MKMLLISSQLQKQFLIQCQANPGKQNWNDYSPALLKTKISEPLIINIPASSDLSQVIKHL